MTVIVVVAMRTEKLSPSTRIKIQMVQLQCEIVEYDYEQHGRKPNVTHILNKGMQRWVLTTGQFDDWEANLGRSQEREHIHRLRMCKLKAGWEEYQLYDNDYGQF